MQDKKNDCASLLPIHMTVRLRFKEQNIIVETGVSKPVYVQVRWYKCKLEVLFGAFQLLIVFKFFCPGYEVQPMSFYDPFLKSTENPMLNLFFTAISRHKIHRAHWSHGFVVLIVRLKEYCANLVPSIWYAPPVCLIAWIYNIGCFLIDRELVTMISYSYLLSMSK